MKNIAVSVTDKTYAGGRKWAALEVSDKAAGRRASQSAPQPRSIFRTLSTLLKKHAETVQPQAAPIKSTS
jgi:hypothetical protein